MLRLERGAVAAIDCWDAEAELPCQRLGQRSLHDALQSPELVPIERQLIVLHHPAILRLELGDDTEVSIHDAFRAAGRLAVVEVGLAFRMDNIQWHFQPDLRGCLTMPILVLVAGRARGITSS